MTEINNPNSITKAWFQNRGLFSDYFLKERLIKWGEWNFEDVTVLRDKLTSLYNSKKDVLAHLSEAQTEQEFIQPVLDILGYADTYIVQAPTKIGKKSNRPDYALFPDKETKNKAYKQLKVNNYTNCIGIADAKYWERELDLPKSSDKDTYTNLNPSFQIVSYSNWNSTKMGNTHKR